MNHMTAEAEAPMLELAGIARVYSDGTGLHPTTITVNRGEIVSVLGPSGCGKTTLMRCIAGLEAPDVGTIRLAGLEVFNAGSTGRKGPRRVDVPAAKRNVSMVFQDLALWPHLTVADNVEFPLTTRGKRIPVAERRHRVYEALELVGIATKAAHRPHQLSGGQQQRVAIARAVVDLPDLLLLDEPLSALDAALRVQIRQEIVELTRVLGLTVLYITHDQEEALSMGDRLLVMNTGRVAQFDRPVDVYERPADDFVADFVGTMDRLDDGFAVRPERVGIVTPGCANAEPAPSGKSIPAVVRSCSYMGGRYELRCDVPDAPRPWLLHDRSYRAPGTRIQLQIISPADQRRANSAYTPELAPAMQAETAKTL